MAKLQKQFVEFNDAIKLERFDENKVLRQKRDIILDKLRNRLKIVFEERDETPPSFVAFDQGSYAMNTGVKPLGDSGDYDIDEGIVFDLDKNDFADPVEVKKWVHEALDGHTTNVWIRKPCVTVAYSEADKILYHVDLAIYAHDGTGSEAIYLARGKPGSLPENKRWELSDPQGLCNKVTKRFENEDEARQFRRCIRYLKRWRDVKFSSDGNAAPVGIGITVAAFHWFQPQRDRVDSLQNKYQDNDLQALRVFVETLVNRFQDVWHEEQVAKRLQAYLPVEPYDNPFARMTNNQMDAFREKLEKLLEILRYAENSEVDPVVACEALRKQFGDDFPVPRKESTGKSKSPAILTSSTSA